MTGGLWSSLWTYVGIFVVAVIIGFTVFSPRRARRPDPINTRTDAAFQREHDDDWQGH